MTHESKRSSGYEPRTKLVGAQREKTTKGLSHTFECKEVAIRQAFADYVALT
jgi:ribosomal protein L44E